MIIDYIFIISLVTIVILCMHTVRPLMNENVQYQVDDIRALREYNKSNEQIKDTQLFIYDPRR